MALLLLLQGCERDCCDVLRGRGCPSCRGGVGCGCLAGGVMSHVVEAPFERGKRRVVHAVTEV